MCLHMKFGFEVFVAVLKFTFEWSSNTGVYFLMIPKGLFTIEFLGATVTRKGIQVFQPSFIFLKNVQTAHT